MPATFQEISRALHWDSAASAFDPSRAVLAFAFYQGNSRRAWSAANRSGEERNRLGLCAYNAGLGSCLKAQGRCGNPILWEHISPCLSDITGALADQTRTYIDRITKYAAEIGERK